MNHSLVLVDQETPQITQLSLNRPDRRNALSMAMLKELHAAIVAAGTRDTARILILRGKGPVFSAGLDLGEAAEPNDAECLAEAVARLLSAVYRSPLVTIAAVQGGAYAGGAGLMAACDFVVAAENASIGFPEVRRGLVPALVLTLLHRQLRERDLRELALLGVPVDAARALKMGLIDRVVAESQLTAETHRIAESVLAGAPQAVRQTKRILVDLRPRSIDDELKQALEEHPQARASEEAQEGIHAFLEKREPHWH